MGEESSSMAEEEKTLKPKSSKPHFVLIHGMSLGSWCWYKIKCLMEVSGFTVSCIDLAASGIHLSKPDSIFSFDEYNQPLMDFFSALPENEQVILVGHSAGGLSVTQATRRFSKKISLAVYIAGSMLKFGFQTVQDSKDGAPDLSGYGDACDFRFGLGPENPPTSALIKVEFQRELLFQQSPQQDCALAALLMRPAPIMALTTAKFQGDEELDDDDVPRVFIKTKHDRVLKPEQQDTMVKKWPPTQVHVVDSDHSPFFSNPFVLFGLLIKAAASVGCV